MRTVKRRRRQTARENGPDPVDVYVGRRVRLAREHAGLTQIDVSKALGMSFQVVQKYEQGDIRVSASRLFQLSQLLHQPIAYFFAALDSQAPQPAGGTAMDGRELALLNAYRRIDEPTVRQRLLQLVRGMSEQSAAGDGGDGDSGAKG